MRRAAGLGAALLLALGPALAVHSQAQKSATFDEPANLVHGIHNLATGDVSVPVEPPPLSRLVAAASLRLSGGPVYLAQGRVPWSPTILPHLAQRILYLENDADRLLFRARLGFVPLQILLAVAVFLWSLRLWGAGGAFASLFLCALSPTLLANAPLITADFCVTACLFLAFSLAWTAARRPTLARLFACGLALGLALLSKVTALLALPVLALCFAARAAAPPPWDVGAWRARRLPLPGGTPGGRGRAWASAALAYALVVAVALAAVWGAYSFRYHPWSPDDPHRAEKQALFEELRSRNLLESAPQRLALSLAERLRILPEPYLMCVRLTFRHMKHWLSFFLGERTIEGNVLYFPVTFLLKTPLALQLLLAAAAVALVRRRVALPGVDAAFLLLFPGLYFAATLFSHLNLGHRYLLPVYPFLFVLAGGIAAPAWRSLAGRIALVALLAWYGGSALRIHPDHLTYFNEIAGGPRGGLRFLGDSNLDWGQDLRGVGPWMERHGVARIKLAYFGTALPEYYGFDFEWLPSVGFLNDREGEVTVEAGDHLAVSATCLQGFYFQDMGKYRFLDAFEPVGAIGNSIYLYHLVPERRRPGAASPWPAPRAR